MFRPHSISPSPETVRCAIVYKNFAAHKGISHIGLGVTAMTNAKVLRENGFWVDVWPVVNNIDIVNNIKKTNEEAAVNGQLPLSHVVISAPWLSTYDLSTMVHTFPDIHFAVISHSNIGFLQADPSGIRLLREAGNLSVGVPNFSIGGNSKKFVETWRHIYQHSAVYLPNLYYIGHEPDTCHKHHNGGTLRIGAFGAVRPLKNILSAGAAALSIAKHNKSSNLEFWISGGRFEGGGDVVLRALEQMYNNLPNAKLVIAPWKPWPEFRKIIGSMDLLIQVSYTESFNMVTADGISQGVASVVSDAIDWVPKNWVAKHDDVMHIAETGLKLLNSKSAARDGLKALKTHNEEGLRAWKAFLLNERCR